MWIEQVKQCEDTVGMFRFMGGANTEVEISGSCTCEPIAYTTRFESSSITLVKTSPSNALELLSSSALWLSMFLGLIWLN